jgi:hypothetical protein
MLKKKRAVGRSRKKVAEWTRKKKWRIRAEKSGGSEQKKVEDQSRKKNNSGSEQEGCGSKYLCYHVIATEGGCWTEGRDRNR